MIKKLHQYKAVLFDLDGTMVDNMGVHLRTWVELLQTMGVTISADEFHHRFSGQTNPSIFKGLFGARFNADEVDRMAAHKEALYRERFAPDLKPLPGLPQLLDTLEANAIPAGVASSGPSINVFFVIDGLGWRPRFKAIITGDEITNCKPHPEAFLKTAEKLQVPPASCLVFEDAPSGIEAARVAGMDVIAMTTTMSRNALESQTGVGAICSNFHEALDSLCRDQ